MSKNILDNLFNKKQCDIPDDNTKSSGFPIDIPGAKCAPTQKVNIYYGNNEELITGDLVQGDNIILTGVLSDRLIGEGNVVIEATIPDLSNYYTKTELQTSGDAQVHWDNITNAPVLSDVAYSGDYEDLLNKPAIPDLTGYATEQWVLDQNYITGVSWTDITGDQSLIGNVGFSNTAGYITLSEVPAQVQTDWDATSGLASILNKPVLATVATTGDYNDLVNQPSIPDLSGYATETWVTSQGYLTSVPWSFNVNNGDLTINGVTNNLDGRWLERSEGVITSGYGITVNGDLATGMGIELDTTVVDNRYLRKDVNDLTINSLSIGGNFGVAGNTELQGLVYFNALTTGTTSDQMLVRDPVSNLVKYTNMPSFGGEFTVANNAGTPQFTVANGQSLRINATGDASVAFNAATRTVTINSSGGSTGGGVDSWNARTGVVVPLAGDYTTAQVTESGGNLYFNETRVRATTLTGISIVDAPITFSDAIVNALGKAQGQINARVPTSRQLTINGTSGSITVSGGTQTLAANRTWTINLANKGTAGTYTKVTTDAQGRVASGGSLTMADLPAGVSQTLVHNASAAAGNIGVTPNGNTVYLTSLARDGAVSTSFSSWSAKAAGLYPFANTTGSTEFPSTTGAGLYVNRNGGTSTLGAFALWTSNAANNALYYNIGDGTSSEWLGWEIIASRSWVASQIPTNYVTTDTTQTGLSGNKEWLGHHRIAPNNTTPLTASAYSFRFTRNTAGSYMSIDNSSGSGAVTLYGYSQNGIQLNLLEGGINAPTTSTVADGPYRANGNVILGANNSGATVVAATDNIIYLRPNAPTSQIGQVQISATSITANQLTGSGTQMVVANAAGTLSRQAIPAVGVTSVSAGNGMNFSTITGTGSVTLGTPGNITLSSTNSVTATSHTHAFAPGGTTAQYIRGDGSLATFPSIPAGTVTSVNSGTGLTGGPITSSGTLSISAAYSPNTSTALGTTNLDTVQTPGFYHQTANAEATTARNYPTNFAGNLQVYRDAGVTQIYNNYSSGITHIRNNYQGTWSEWVRTDYRPYTLPAATATVRGGIELFSNTVQSVAANSVTSTASRTYGIQVNSAGQAVVNVPWTNNTYSAGDGLTGTSTFSVNNTVLRTTGNQSASGIKTFTGELVANILTLGAIANSTTTINMASSNLVRLNSISSSTTYTMSNNSEGRNVQCLVTNTSGSVVTVSVTGARLLGVNSVGPGKRASISIINFGSETVYSVLSEE